MTIDPRLAERRKAVAEDHAKRSVGRLLKIIGFVVVAGGLVWVAFSPWLSINQVRTAGINVSDSNRVLVNTNVIAGTPMILLRPGQVEEALVADPWVKEARVHLNWPNEVIVRVEERVPVAWIETFDGWTRSDIDGVAVPSASTPDESYPWVHLRGVTNQDAEIFTLGAVEFIDALEPQFHEELALSVEAGEMWARVAGFEVRLGRPTEMTAKALSLEALLKEPIPKGSTLVMVAPSNPAVSAPVTDESPEDSTTDGAEVDQGGESDADSRGDGQP